MILPRLKIAALLLGVAVLIWMFGRREVLSHSLTCTKCQTSYHVAEHRFCGFRHKTTKKLQRAPTDYEELYGRKCEHIYHRIGSGGTIRGFRSVIHTDAGSREQRVFGDRNWTIRYAFMLRKHLGSDDLARESLDYVESQLPADTDWAQRDAVLTNGWHNVQLFRDRIHGTRTVEAWSNLLEEARSGKLQTLHEESHNKPE